MILPEAQLDLWNVDKNFYNDYLPLLIKDYVSGTYFELSKQPISTVQEYVDTYYNYFKTTEQDEPTVEYIKQLGQATKAYEYFKDLYPEYFI